MKEGLSRHRKFPLIDSWSGLLNSISSQLPVFLTSVFFSSTIVGYYALGHRVLQLPMTFIGSAIAQVFFQRASVANLEGSITNLVESAFTRLIMIGLFPSIIILLAGKDLFMLIFGDSWAEAGVYAQILSPWIFFVFITSPLSTMFAVTEKQGKFLKMNILLFITRMATLIIGGLIGSPRLALALFSLAGMIIWIYMCSYILKESDVPIFPILKNTAIYLFYVMPSLILIIIAKYVMLLTPISLLIISVVGAIFYYICILRKDYVLRSYLLGILKPFFSK